MSRLVAPHVPITPERRTTVSRDLNQVALISRDYLVLAVLSCVIATFGLVINSAAVIIGAMLIAPLMPPILAFAHGLVRTNLDQVWRSLATLLLGFLLAVLVSALLGRAVSGTTFNFLAELPAEVLSRTQPTLFDLVVALAGGAAAAYALTQPNLSATLPGVAIATALMPPVCVIGIGLSQGRRDVASGALLLFLANFVAITFSGAIVFLLLGFQPQGLSGRRWFAAPRALLVPTLLLLLVTVPLAGFMVRIITDLSQNAAIRSAIVTELQARNPDNSLVDFEKQASGDTLAITATVRATRDLSYDDELSIQKALAADLHRRVALQLLVIPVTRLAPLAPPTRSPGPRLVVSTTVTATPTSAARAPVLLPTPTPLSATPAPPTARPTVPLARTLARVTATPPDAAGLPSAGTGQGSPVDGPVAALMLAVVILIGCGSALLAWIGRRAR